MNSGCSLNTVVKPVVKPFTRYNRLSNRVCQTRYDNRLCRVNGVIKRYVKVSKKKHATHKTEREELIIAWQA